MTSKQPWELKASLTKFVRYPLGHLDREESEAQVFPDRLFKAFGHPALAEVGTKLEEANQEDMPQRHYLC